jgi:dTDP-4-dehydrorhamnose reductase
MRIMVTGVKGQLGWELRRVGTQEGIDIIGADLPEFTITDPSQIQQLLISRRPDLVINAAAYTQVDRAEEEPEIAYAVNRDGAEFLASSCRRARIPLFHVSTDFVFDGKKTSPYVEHDPVAPLGVYGMSKAAGEEAVRHTLEEHLIVRTSWLYGYHGHNFVKTMLTLGQERSLLRVVADQVGSPTCAADLAQALLDMAQQYHQQRSIAWGTYHYCGKGHTSWHGLATEIFSEVQGLTALKVVKVEAISTADYPTPARRPIYSVLDCTAIAEDFGIEPPPWKTSLSRTLKQILSSYDVN